LKDAAILIVDDQETALTATEALFESWGYANVVGTSDPTRAVELAHQISAELVILDLHMPGGGGFGLIEALVSRNGGGEPPAVMIVSGDVSVEARERALGLGAKDFLIKPFGTEEARIRVKNLLETRALHKQLLTRGNLMEHRLAERTSQLRDARLDVLQRLALAGEYRDDSTHEHPQRVGRTAAALARAAGLDDDRGFEIRHAAPLHDIGKIGIPDSVLLQPGRLGSDDFELMKTHTVIGKDILAGSGSPLLDAGAEIAVTHHERGDGAGYPAGLAGEAIPISGRLVAVADTFDAITHKRPWREARPLITALEEMAGLAGTQLDPQLLRCFDTLDHQALLAPIGDWDVE
jgi:putative two-component system response regulator